MNETSYLYVVDNKFVAYADFKDSAINRQAPDLKRFVLATKNVVLFMKYYQLRFHPKALKNIVD
jgi:hypothetical protein